MSEPREDPVVTQGRREMLFSLVMTFAAMGYSITYCVRHGYRRSIDDLTFVLGFPDWVFWGIVVPWLVCVAVGIWMAFFFIGDAPFEDGEVIGDEKSGEAPRQ
ncbi:MAG: YhdT family protein [Pirellulales bacterium]|nr:YhdT family protein [Pirellulales bacterium]